jgi:quinol-cytochrome oxidoreductase complex cytochrome b subunit
MFLKKNKARINYAVDLVIGLSFIAAAVSGLILLAAGNGGFQGGRNPRYAQDLWLFSRWTWREIHDWGGMVMVAGVLAHLLLHWKWMVCMTRNLFRRNIRAGKAEACPAAS